MVCVELSDVGEYMMIVNGLDGKLDPPNRMFG